MTCPACKNLMCEVDERFLCPVCKGEFFTQEQAEEIDELWHRSITLYYKALRDEKKTYGDAAKHGFLRRWGQEREDWDAMLKMF